MRGRLPRCVSANLAGTTNLWFQDVRCMGELIIPIIARLACWAVRFCMKPPNLMASSSMWIRTRCSQQQKFGSNPNEATNLSIHNSLMNFEVYNMV